MVEDIGLTIVDIEEDSIDKMKKKDKRAQMMEDSDLAKALEADDDTIDKLKKDYQKELLLVEEVDRAVAVEYSTGAMKDKELAQDKQLDKDKDKAIVISLKDKRPIRFIRQNGDESAKAILFDDGTVECSGDAEAGGDPGNQSPLLEDVISIASTFSAFAALRSDGMVVAWGHPGSGGDLGNYDLVDVFGIESSAMAFAALLSDGTVFCWGDSDYGGDTGDKQELLVDVKEILSCKTGFGARKTDGTFVFWGWV